MVTAAQIELPAGAVLVTDPEALVVAVNESPSESTMESEVDAAGAGVVEEKPDSAE
jgi:large subunit ribosomal protein L25